MKTIDVLAIESDRSEAESMKKMLSASGEGDYSFSLARRPDEGLRSLSRNEVDVLLFDLNQSIDSASSLRHRFPDVAIILLTSQEEESIAREALAHGIDDYLVKGRITSELLAKTIRSSMERKRLEQEIASLHKERDRLEQEVARLASHDSVTGLPGSRLFTDRLSLECERARRQSKKLALLSLSIDGVADVMQSMGPDAGDVLLREAAARLRSHLRRSDTVARIGQSEFNIILPDIARPDHVADVSRGIMDAFAKPFLPAGNSLPIESRIGISIYPDDAEEPDQLLKYADAARREAGMPGQERFRFHDESVNMRSQERSTLRTLLRRGIASGEIEIFYQPLFDVTTRRIVCAEALSRWRHPEKGLLSPNDFIPAAEEVGLLKAIDEQVFRTVCGQTKAWLDAGLRPACVTVNLSARQVHDPGLLKTVTSILDETGLPAGCIYLEVTEKTIMSNDRASERLKELAGLGFHISIDDFGTGYTSVNQLERLPVKRLKIDRLFIRRVPADPDSRTIVRSVTSLAHNMRMKAVAEGVETEHQFTFLKSIGCDEMQGYLFSRPLPAVEFEKLIRTKR